LRGGRRATDPGQAADAAARAPPRGRAVPALRPDAEGRALRGLRDRLLPARPDRRTRAQGPPAVATAALTRHELASGAGRRRRERRLMLVRGDRVQTVSSSRL